jgi:hypothetical protein
MLHVFSLHDCKPKEQVVQKHQIQSMKVDAENMYILGRKG